MTSRGTRTWAAGICIAIAAAASLPAAAGASTGGAGTPAGSPPPPGSATGSPAADAPSAGVLSLISARTAPRRSFYYGIRYPVLRFEIASTQAENDLWIAVVNPAREVVRTFYRNDVAPNTKVRIRWDGTTDEGLPARNGRYRFRIGAQGGAARISRGAGASTAPPPLRLGFVLFGFAFPLLGRHEMGGAAGRFGAPRSGHTHQGQDVMARCGLPVVAARGGTVQYSGYHGAAGNYVVIDGKGTRLDFMYAHLRRRSPLRTGDPVRTGQPIGVVGRTGDASACHLHFEIWTGPGWYEGGRPLNPLPYLTRWDRYS